MELKRITGPDVRTALRMVREQLGPDAMILSNRRTGEGVEIIASLAPGALESRAVPARQAAPAPAPLPAHPVALAPRTAAQPTAQFIDMQNELRSMRSFLESRLDEISAGREPFAAGVEGRAWGRLTRMGIPNAQVHELVGAIAANQSWEEAWRATLNAFAHGLHEAGDLVADGGIFAFVGPTGAGKSTTLCKLAVRQVLEHGAAGLVLISMDGMRLGGSDMLRAVARLLGVPFHVAAEGESLEEMLGRVGNPRLLLIDTAGYNRRLAQHGSQLDSLGSMSTLVQTLLVLPANAQLSCLESAVADYRRAAPTAAVLTKLDETRSLGEVLGLLRRERIALAYSADGPEIPDDLQLASAVELVHKALALVPREPEPAALASMPSMAMAPAATAVVGGIAARIA